MGTGIGSVCALNGFETVLYDVNEQALNKSNALIFRGYDILIEKGKINETQRKDTENRIDFTPDINKVCKSDFIIEAALENIDLKKIIYSQLDELTGDDVILSSNTSSISITALAGVIKKNRARVAGMHFFNPVRSMKLVEVIRSEFTSDDTMSTVIEVAKKLGKHPVICKDTPAFIVNRIARSYYGEALKIAGEGSPVYRVIDEIMREEGGFRMGPFELMDMIGIDVNYSVTKSVYEAFFYDPKYRPHPIQYKMVEAGLFGKKTGRGFYEY
jgi:3-hydroxybutyryl-CoA dehydrogenase